MNFKNSGTAKKRLFIAVTLGSVLAVTVLFQNCADDVNIAELTSLGNDNFELPPPVIVQADTDSDQYLPISKIQIDGANGPVFVVDAADLKPLSLSTTLSRGFIPVDTAKTYQLSGTFRSVSTNPAASFYFGISCYDANKNRISDTQTYRSGNAVTVGATTTNSIITVETLTGWNISSAPAYSRMIGFYYDGNINRIPDFVLSGPGDTYSTAATDGAFNSATANLIQLNISIPAAELKKITQFTKILNHSAGGNYNYSAWGALPNIATTYTQKYTGVAFNNPLGVFRPGTKYVKFLILPLYQQSETAAKMTVNNLQFVESIP